MSKIKDKLLDAVEAARPTVSRKVIELLDDVIFPFYELHSPYGHMSKQLRHMVAEKIAVNISSNLWISKGEAVELDDEAIDDVNCHPFIVVDVFPQNTSASSYDIMVTLSQRSVPSNVVTLGMNQFMRDFYPLRDIDFREFDS